MTKLRVLDLFSGIGGFSLGLERTGGFETVAFCEIEEFPRRVLKKHWPEVPCYHDVRALTADALRRDRIAVDVITGGFPCQDLSIAGSGAGLDGERSGLWREIVRLAGEIRPGYVIVENVAALLGRGLGRVLGDLAALGYDAEWHCIPSGRLGSPHERDRIWVIAYPNSWRGRAEPAQGHNADWQNPGRQETDSLLGAIPSPSSQWYLADPDASNDHSERRRQYYGAEVAVHPRHTGLAGPISHDGWDTPWPQFLADICGVDDGIRGGLDKAGFAALGNAVVPQIPELIGRAILQARSTA